jgi:hypothetical protein
MTNWKRRALALGVAAVAGVGSLSASSCSSWVDSNLAPSPLDAATRLPDANGRPVVFKTDIRPLMNRGNTDPTGHGCKACHYPTFWGDRGTDSTGLDLSTLGALRKGGYNSPNIVVPGDPKGSAFVQKLRGTFPIGAHMPRDGPPFWSEAQVQLVERWIAEGANGEDDE